MIESNDLTEIGFLYKPHGFRGEINAVLDYDEHLFDNHTPFIINIDGINVPFFPESIRNKGKENCIIKFKNINSESDAVILVNHPIYFIKKQLLEISGLEEEDLEDNDSLEGASVMDEATGTILGTVARIEEGKEYDYLIVENRGENREFSIPLISPFIVKIEDDSDSDIRIYVDLPEGMIDLN